MKKILLLLLFPAIGISQESNLDWILAHMKGKSIESYTILNLYDNLPQNLSYTASDNVLIRTKKGSETYSYLNLLSKKSTLKSMATNVHEICHGLTGMYFFNEMDSNYIAHDSNNITSYFFISEDIIYVSIFRGDVFPSSVLKNLIPESLITSRYETYILGDSSTQEEGIIGLLDELNAYYHGTKFSFDMLPIYKTVYPDNYLNEWVMGLQSTMTAYYEFDFWIKEYLLHAKINYPELFSEIIKKGSALDIFISIREKYKTLISKYSEYVKVESGKIKYYYDTEFWDSDYYKLIDRLKTDKYNSINNLLSF